MQSLYIYKIIIPMKLFSLLWFRGVKMIWKCTGYGIYYLIISNHVKFCCTIHVNAKTGGSLCQYSTTVWTVPLVTFLFITIFKVIPIKNIKSNRTKLWSDVMTASFSEGSFRIQALSEQIFTPLLNFLYIFFIKPKSVTHIQRIVHLKM